MAHYMDSGQTTSQKFRCCYPQVRNLEIKQSSWIWWHSVITSQSTKTKTEQRLLLHGQYLYAVLSKTNITRLFVCLWTFASYFDPSTALVWRSMVTVQHPSWCIFHSIAFPIYPFEKLGHALIRRKNFILERFQMITQLTLPTAAVKIQA